jgi:hypothetical protein
MASKIKLQVDQNTETPKENSPIIVDEKKTVEIENNCC